MSDYPEQRKTACTKLTYCLLDKGADWIKSYGGMQQDVGQDPGTGPLVHWHVQSHKTYKAISTTQLGERPSRRAPYNVRP